MKLIGAGSLFVGLGVIGIPNILKNFREGSALTASAQGVDATNTTNATGTSTTNTTNATGATTSGNTDIRPFRVNVPEAEQGLIVTKRGLVERHTYYFPQVLVDRFDGQTLFLKITAKDAAKYEGR